MARRRRTPAGPAAAAPALELAAAPGHAAAWPLAAAAALTALLALVSLTPLTNNDTWLHLANGRWILQNGHVPLTDPYSFAAAGNRFYAHEWLAGIVFHLVHRASGVGGLIVFKALLGGVALILPLLAARRMGAGPLAAIGTTAMAVAIVNSRWLERPEMFSYIFTGIHLLVLGAEHRRLRRGPRAAERALLASRLWLLVPVHLLWVQMHGYFITGIAMQAAFLGAAALDLWRDARDRPFRHAALRDGALALAVALVAGLLNPNGLEAYTFPFQLAGGDNIFMRTIFEWRPTFTTAAMTDSSMFLAFCVWIGLLAATGLAEPAFAGRPSRLRVVFGVAIAGLVLLHPAIGLAPATFPLSLAGSHWLRTPVDLLASWSGSDGLRALAGMPLVARACPSMLGLLLSGLAIGGVLGRQRPLLPAAAAVTALVALAFRGAGGTADVLLPLLLAGLLGRAWWRGLLPAWLGAVALIFALLVVRQNRNIVPFALVTLPILAPGITRLADLGRAARARRERLAGGLLTGLLALAAVATFLWGWPYTPSVVKRAGLGLGPRVPAAAVAWIRAAGLEGRVFNKYAYGAYLIHELWPGTRVAMDSRNDVYGPELYGTYLKALQDSRVATDLLAASAVDYVVTDYSFGRGSEDVGLHEALRANPAFVLTYFDDHALVYVARRGRFASLAEREGFTVLDPVRYRPGATAALDAVSAARFAAETERALHSLPRSLATRMMRVEALATTRRDAEARALLDEVLREEPGQIYALITAGNLARRQGDARAARRYYERALARDPGRAELRSLLEELGEDTP